MFNTGCSKAIELSSFVLLLVLMTVSVPLSYKCAVYFLLKNLHFIFGSVKGAEWQSSAISCIAAPSINYYDMLCKRSMLFCVLFFSNSLFLRQSFLEVHILTITYQKALILGP